MNNDWIEKSTMSRYHVKFDGEYVCEKDYEYLVECNKEESNFPEFVAESLKKQCPERVELELIINAKEETSRT